MSFGWWFKSIDQVSINCENGMQIYWHFKCVFSLIVDVSWSCDSIEEKFFELNYRRKVGILVSVASSDPPDLLAARVVWANQQSIEQVLRPSTSRSRWPSIMVETDRVRMESDSDSTFSLLVLLDYKIIIHLQTKYNNTNKNN